MRHTFILFLLWSCSPNPAAVQQVFITESGTKYHREACHYLGQSSYTVDMSEAQQSGLLPCKLCWAAPEGSRDALVNSSKSVDGHAEDIDSASLEEQGVPTQCSAIAKTTGSRCRRTTNSQSGKCWQHEE